MTVIETGAVAPPGVVTTRDSAAPMVAESETSSTVTVVSVTPLRLVCTCPPIVTDVAPVRFVPVTTSAPPCAMTG